MTRYRFRLKELRINPQQAAGSTYYIVEDDTSGVRHRLSEAEYATAELLDGRRSLGQVAKLVAKRTGLAVSAEDVEHFAEQLLALGFVSSS